MVSLLQKLEILPESFDFNLKIIYISSNAKKILFVTHDLKAYKNGGTNWIEIQELRGLKIEEFFQGWQATYARTFENFIYSWGNNDFGQLGRITENEEEKFNPQMINYFKGKKIKIVEIACGNHARHCLALSDQFKVYGWGRNNFQQVCKLQEEIIKEPKLLEKFEMVTSINCYKNSSILVNNFKIKFFGYISEKKTIDLEPVKSYQKKNIKMIKAITDEQYAYLLQDGGVILWIKDINNLNSVSEKNFVDIKEVFNASDSWILCENENRAFKMNTINKVMKPTNYKNMFEISLHDFKYSIRTLIVYENNFYINYISPIFEENGKLEHKIYSVKARETVEQPEDIQLKNILKMIPEKEEVLLCYISKYFDENKYFSILKTIKNEILCYGINANGKLGFGHDIDILEYQKNYNMNIVKIIKFFETEECMFGIDDEGDVIGWGENVKKLLFEPSNGKILSPNYILQMKGYNLIQITCGDEYCLARSSEGQVYGWGDNNKRGNNEILFRKLDIVEKISYILAEKKSYFALSENGIIYSWGHNKYGQLIHDKKINLHLNFPSKVENYIFQAIISNGIKTYVETSDGKIVEFSSKNFNKEIKREEIKKSLIFWKNDDISDSNVSLVPLYLQSLYDRRCFLNNLAFKDLEIEKPNIKTDDPLKFNLNNFFEDIKTIDRNVFRAKSKEDQNYYAIKKGKTNI